jgi:hypothetical protein
MKTIPHSKGGPKRELNHLLPLVALFFHDLSQDDFDKYFSLELEYIDEFNGTNLRTMLHICFYVFKRYWRSKFQ